MTVKELLDRIDSSELTEWIAFYDLEPFGDERADIRSAIVASTTANVWGAKTKLSDFIPRWEKPEPTPWQKVKGYFMSLAQRNDAQ